MCQYVTVDKESSSQTGHVSQKSYYPFIYFYKYFYTVAVIASKHFNVQGQAPHFMSPSLDHMIEAVLLYYYHHIFIISYY